MTTTTTSKKNETYEHLHKQVLPFIPFLELKHCFVIPMDYTGFVLHPDQSIGHYSHGLLHQIDGPALMYPNGKTEWYFQGVLHREDGPARIMPDGKEYWFHHGKHISFNNP